MTARQPGQSQKFAAVDAAVAAILQHHNSPAGPVADQAVTAASDAILLTYSTIEADFEADGDHTPEIDLFAGRATRQRRAKRQAHARRWKTAAIARCEAAGLLAFIGARLLAWLVTFAIRRWFEQVSDRETANEFAAPTSPPSPDPNAENEP